MNVTAVVNHARRARRQSTAEDKLDELAKAIEALATVLATLAGRSTISNTKSATSLVRGTIS